MAWTTQTDSVLRTKVRRLINQPSAVDITNTDIDYWIDMGAQAVSNESLCRHEVTTLALVESQRSYSLPDYAIKIHNVLYTSATFVTSTITVSSDERELYFTHSVGGAGTIRMSLGVYSPIEFAAKLKYQLDNHEILGGAGTVSYTVGYSESTEKFTITPASGTIAFTYASSDSDLADDIGFKVDAVAASSIVSDTATGLSTAWSSSAASLIRIHPRLYKHLDEGTAGVPVYWTEFDDQIHIHPIPAASQAGKGLYVLYSSNVGEASDKATYLPAYLQEYVIFYAVARAFESQGKLAPAQQYMSIFNNFMQFHKMEKMIESVDSRDMMSLPDRTQYVE